MARRRTANSHEGRDPRGANAARDRERQLQRLFERSHVGVITWQGETIVEANEAYLDAIGYSREELARGGVRWTELTPPEHVASDARALAEIAERGWCSPYRKQLFRKDGRRVDVLIASASVDAAGSGGIAIVVDLSAEVEARRHAAHGEARLHALLENASDVVQLLGADGVVLYASPSTQRILGVPPAEYVGRSVFERVHPDDRSELERQLRAAQAQPGVMLSGEFRLRHQDGTYRDIEARRVNRLADPSLGAVVECYRDATDRKRLEERVLHAQKMDAVGRLAGGIAHDFNNMLSAILGFGRLVQTELGPGHPLTDDVGEIVSAAERAATLTGQLLTLSRRQVVAPRVLDLNEHLVGMQRMLARVLGESVEVELRLAPDLGRVRVDPGQLEQVVLNLAINARDAMPEGGTITLETGNVVLDERYAEEHVGVTPGRHVRLVVADTGTGMTREVRARAFEPYFTTKEGRGTGLGLATVFGIVKQSGGHIWLYSEPGGGTTFKIDLPRCDEAADGAAARPPESESLEGTETILVVEDEDAVRQLVHRVLHRRGYTVLLARHGDEGLLLAERRGGGIDLLLTDVVMPRMGGKLLASRLRERTPSLQVVYMSGYTEDTIAQRGVLEEGAEFLTKPLAPDALLRKVRDVLDRRTGRT